MDANVCDKDHNPTNCYLTVTTRIVFDRAAEENAGHGHNCGNIFDGEKRTPPMQGGVRSYIQKNREAPR
jgi:hypothetical protein